MIKQVIERYEITEEYNIVERIDTRKQAEQFGIENRLLQCTEECGELIQALSKYQRILQGDKTCQTDMCHAEYMIADEIADVELLLEQIKCLLGNEREVRERKLYKLDRTEQRLLE
jgi:NTP pyrophosphatase (non-canonical NTP hydrolase)